MRDYNIESDLKQEKFEVIKLVQGDKGNKLTINVLEDGKPVSLTGCSITAKYKRADGQVINGSVINISNNSFDAVIDSDITKVVGTLKMLFSIEKDDVKVSTFLLLADVREGLLENTGSSGGSTGGGEVTVDLSNYYKKNETYSKAQIDSQFKDVAKKTDIPDVSTKVDKVAGKGLSTNDYTNEDKQKLQNCISGSNIDSAVSAYLEAHPITGGITATAKNLLIAILRNGVYTSDQSSNITNLVGALSASGGDTPSITYYNITNNLTNCTNGNINSTVEENTSYSCAITANSGYELNTVTVTMGGVDITSTAYSNGNIAISKVTGNIVITATATEKQVVAEMPTNGLVDLFDFRNCEYDNSSTTKIKATKGNGGLYGWFNSGVEKQDAKYGIKSSKTYSYSTDYSTNGASANSSFTQVFMSYFSTNTGNNPLFNPTWGKLSNVGALTFTPAYIDTTDASKKLANENIAGSRGGWIRIILSVDATTKICKLYVNDKCVSTHDGNSITDFKNWATNISMKLLNVNTNGDYYMTQFALYNKALSEVEVTEAMAYLKTLEVA